MLMVNKGPLFVCLQPTRLPLLAARVSLPLLSMLKEFLAKRKIILFLVRFEHTTLQLQSQCTTNSCFVLILIILGLHYHYSHPSITLK